MNQPFDPNAFLNATFNDSNDTKYVLTPVGDYLGQIEPLDDKSFEVGEKDGKQWARLNLRITVHGDERIKTATGLDKRTLRGQIFLDLTPAGGLDFGPGRNIQLGRVREAVGLNIPGQPFAFNMLGGKMVKFSVGHRVDPKDASKIYEDVKAYFPAY